MEQRRDELVAAWARSAAPGARPPGASPEPIPAEVGRAFTLLARAADQLAAGEEPAVLGELLLLGPGFVGTEPHESLQALISLREVLLDALDAAHFDASAMRWVVRAVDAAVARKAQAEAGLRQRMLDALDRITAFSADTTDLGERLQNLLEAYADAVGEAVDRGVIFVREGDLFRARASIGLEPSAGSGLTVPYGQGFIGRIAAQGRPMQLRDAAGHPLLQNPPLPLGDVKALHGVTLVAGSGAVIGVACIGSTRTNELRREELLLFGAMADRGASFLDPHLLRVAAEERAAEHEERERFVRMVLDSTGEGIFGLDHEGRCTFANPAALRLLGYADASQLLGQPLHTRIHEPSPEGDGVTSDCAIHRALLTGERAHRDDEQFWRADGTRLPVEYWAHPMTHGGEVVGAVLAFSDITKRRQIDAERERLITELASQQALFQAVVDQMPAGILIGHAESGQLVVRNRQVDELWRVPPHTVALDDFSPFTCFQPDGQPIPWDRLPGLRSLTTGEVVLDEEIAILRADGHCGTLLARSGPVRDPNGAIVASVVTLYDITERIRNEAAVRFLTEASKALSRTLDLDEVLATLSRLCVPTIADWCVVQRAEDSALRNASVSAADPAQAAVARERLLGRRATTGSPSDGAAEGGAARLLNPAGEDEVVRAVGLESGAAPPFPTGELLTLPLVAGRLSLGRLVLGANPGTPRFDPTTRWLASSLADRASLAADNARLHAEEQQAVRAREQMLAVVSHDLRNPLQVIKMSALLLDREVGVAGKRRLEQIVRSSNRMERLIHDLLDMTSIQAGKLNLHRHPYPAAALAAEALEESEAPAEEKSITLRTEIDLGEVRVEADRTRVLQVFSNLMTNAIKFSPVASTVTLTGRLNDGEVLFSVEDQGSGVPEETEQLFQARWSGTTQAASGSGLGLFIARGIVLAHGGRIWAEKNPGGGARFSFTIPLA